MRIFAVATVVVALSASPAAAQFAGTAQRAPSGTPIWDHPVDSARLRPIEPGVRGDIAGIFGTIRDGRRSGQLTRREARQLRREGRVIESLEARYRRDGLSASELDELRTRVALLRDDITAKRTDAR